MNDHAEALRFVEAMRGWFAGELDVPDPAVPMIWVAGGATPAGDPVVLYRLATGEPIVGRRWDLAELRAMFAPADPESLAEYMWESEVAEPDVSPRRLGVDWADDLVEHPSEVLWFGPAPR